jgi:hypothetical protein
MQRHPQVANIDELEPMKTSKGRFGVTAKRLGAPAGAKAIGFNWMELEKGKTSILTGKIPERIDRSRCKCRPCAANPGARKSA